MPYRLSHPDAAPPKLNRSNAPTELRILIPLAERYGVSDDGYRMDMLATLDQTEREQLIRAVQEWDDTLDAWLAGPEAAAVAPTNEYVAFSALRMAADEA